jgi:hypothetical protein
MFFATFVLAALVAVMLAINLRRPVPSAAANLKVTFLGYTNQNEPVFQLTNPSPRSLQVGPYGWLITKEGQAFGSIALPGPPDGLLAAHNTFTFAMPPPLCGHPWRAQFAAESVGWKQKWNNLRVKLSKLGLPIGAPVPSVGSSSEVIDE